MAATIAVGAAAEERTPARPRTAVPPPVLGRRTAFPWTAMRAAGGGAAGHVHCVAPSGTGLATSLFAPMIARDLASGVGVTVLEGQGGELAPVVRALCRDRGLPVTVWAPGAAEGGSWNPLSAWASPAGAADALWRALATLDPALVPDAGLGMRLLRQSAGGDLDQIEAALAAVADGTPSDGGGGEPGALGAAGVARRLQETLHQLTGPPMVRRALCPHPGVCHIDMARCLDGPGAVIAALPARPDRPLAAALGGWWLSAAAEAAPSRAEGAPHRVYIEDVPRIAQGQDVASWMDGCAAGGVGLVMGSRSPDHVRTAGPAVEAALRGAATARVFLRCAPDQARELAEGWCGEPRLRPETLSELPFGFAIAQTAVRPDRRRLATVRLQTLPRPTAL